MISRKFPETLGFKAVGLVELTTNCSMKNGYHLRTVQTFRTLRTSLRSQKNAAYRRFGRLEPRFALKKTLLTAISMR